MIPWRLLHFNFDAADPACDKIINGGANDTDDEEPAVRNEAARNDDALNIDIITTMLERLMNEGPRLTQPNPEADLADLAQSRRGQSAARA